MTEQHDHGLTFDGKPRTANPAHYACSGSYTVALRATTVDDAIAEVHNGWYDIDRVREIPAADTDSLENPQTFDIYPHPTMKPSPSASTLPTAPGSISPPDSYPRKTADMLLLLIEDPASYDQLVRPDMQHWSAGNSNHHRHNGEFLIKLPSGLRRAMLPQWIKRLASFNVSTRMVHRSPSPRHT